MSRLVIVSNRVALPGEAAQRSGGLVTGLVDALHQAGGLWFGWSGKILEKDQYGYGFDSQSGEYGNLVTKGIIDPTKVVRVAIQNAASVAALLITTEAMVAELPKKNAGGGGMPQGGGMGGMDF